MATRQCTNCGVRLLAHAEYCMACGVAVRLESAREPPGVNPVASGVFAGWIGRVIVIVLLVVAAVPLLFLIAAIVQA